MLHTRLRLHKNRRRTGFITITSPTVGWGAEEGFVQHFQGPTQVCNASAPYGCSGAFVKLTRNQYVQNFRGHTTVCNTTKQGGCVYEGRTYAANIGCWRADDQQIYCY